MYGNRPLSRLESAIYALVVSLVAVAMLDRMLTYFEYAERAAVEATLLRTQSALQTRMTYDVLRGKAPDLGAWSARNPFEVAQVTLANYAGERDLVDPGTLAEGQWAYDRTRRELVYLPRHARALTIEGGGPELRFRLSIGGPGGLPQLVPVAAYRWEPG